MMNKLLKITRILFLSGIMVSYVNIYDVWAYWNEEECKEETVDEEKLLKDNYSKKPKFLSLASLSAICFIDIQNSYSHFFSCLVFAIFSSE